MKKFFVALTMLTLLVCVCACKEKRCACVTMRADYPVTHSIEPLVGKSDCSEVSKEWPANDTTSDLITMTCVPLE